jgi:O-antigen/teichoic acid export membrane protein
MFSSLQQVRARLVPIISGQALGLLCGIIGVRLTSSLVAPADYGRYGVFLSFTTLGMWVVHAGLIKYVSRHWAAAPAKAHLLRAILRQWQRKLPWLTLGAIGASVAIGRLTSLSPWIMLAPLFLVISLLSLAALAQAALQAAREHWRDFSVSATGSVSRTFAPLLLFLALGSAAGLYLGFCLHAVLTLIAGSVMMRRHLKPSATAAGSQPVVDQIYTGPLFTFLSLAGWVLAGTNRWITASFFGDVQAGYFMLASNMVIIVPSLIGTSVLQLFQPDLFRMGDHDTADSLRPLARRVDQVAAGFCGTSLLGVLALHAVMPWLVGPLVHKTYLAALIWIIPVGCFGVATMTGHYYQIMLMAARRERACAPVDITTASIFIAGSTLAALGGQTAFMHWLMLTPAIPWLVTRPLARRYYFKPA